MNKIIDWVLELRPASKIGIGAGILFLLCFIYVGSQMEFSLLTFVGTAVVLLFDVAFITVVCFAIFMLLDGLLNLGE